MDCFELYRCEFAEPALAASAVVGPFDPGHDRDAEFLAGVPGLAIQHVLLQEREERLG